MVSTCLAFVGSEIVSRSDAAVLLKRSGDPAADVAPVEGIGGAAAGQRFEHGAEVRVAIPLPCADRLIPVEVELLRGRVAAEVLGRALKRSGNPFVHDEPVAGVTDRRCGNVAQLLLAVAVERRLESRHDAGDSGGKPAVVVDLARGPAPCRRA